MHTPTIVAQVMQCCLPLMHAARWGALRDVVVSSVNGHALGLVALAVGAPRTISVRHRVKCVDRLLGNIHLKAHRFDLYNRACAAVAVRVAAAPDRSGLVQPDSGYVM